MAEQADNNPRASREGAAPRRGTDCGRQNGGSGNGDGGVVWFRTVRVVEGLLTLLTLCFLLGGPLLSLHDRVNDLDHKSQEYAVTLDGFHRARERHEAAVQILSERCTRLETRLDSLYEQVAELRQWCKSHHK